ncbi:MAG TPA: hypothetical protein VK053_01345 [Jiangellaceae bacterium]|nr:hypothetical protein [Jiangellaceae bacterium]
MRVGNHATGRGPQFEKDSDDLAEALSETCVNIGLFVMLALFVGGVLVGFIS